MSNWTKQFDKEFTNNGSGRMWSDHLVYRDGGEHHIKDIKAFISQTIQEEKLKLLEEIMDMGDKALEESDTQQDFMVRFFDRLRNMYLLWSQLQSSPSQSKEDTK